MSRFPDQRNDDTSHRSQDKKIFFKGLEQCLEAFTSGEGRVVRKYARLFSQLSGKRQEDEEEAISWSSSDEETVSYPNTTIGRKVLRKLNSQINFDTRISAKKNGRRLTKAQFSRSVGHLSQELFGICPDNSVADKTSGQISEGSYSLLNTGVLGDESHNLSVATGISELDNPLPVPQTPRRESKTVDVITSPVFKLNGTSNKKVRRCRKKRKSCNDCISNNNNSNNCNEVNVNQILSVPDHVPSVQVDCSSEREEPFLQLTPQTKATDGSTADYEFTSPVFNKTVMNWHSNVASPVLNKKRASSVSPIMRKRLRRKRLTNNAVPEIPSSPILKTKKKSTVFKRKRQKVATPKDGDQSGSNVSCSVVFDTSDLSTDNSLFSGKPSENTKHTVKRSLDFALRKDNVVSSKNDLQSDGQLSDLIQCVKTVVQPFSHQISFENRRPHTFHQTLREKSNESSDNWALNATNLIEEVHTEELDLSVNCRHSNHRKNRLSLKNNFRERRKSETFPLSPDIIEENSKCLIDASAIEDSQPHVFVAPASRAVFHRLKKGTEWLDTTSKSYFFNQTNVIEEVLTEEMDLSTHTKPTGHRSNSTKSPVEDCEDESQIASESYIASYQKGNLNIQPSNGWINEENAVTNQISQSQVTPCSPSLLTESNVRSSRMNRRLLGNRDGSSEKRKTDSTTTKVKGTAKSANEASSEMRGIFRLPPNARDQSIVISQSSTRSGYPLKGSQTGSPEIESVSSQASCENIVINAPSSGVISKSNTAKRSPVVSSPLVISSAGSSPDVRTADLPFVITEDEYNAPPKRRSKKLDPNGIASRLQRLINQRRSDARIWQYKRSKLCRLTNKEEGDNIQSQGRLLTVNSVRTEYSHVVLFSKEKKGELSIGKEFKENVLVVLDPGVVVRLAKVMNATKIRIYPPWQSMDLADHDITVILGANIVEVLSTESDNDSLNRDVVQSVAKNYCCRCSSSPRHDAVVLDCWDGVQSIGVVDILFPLSAPPSTQLVQFDENTSVTHSCLDLNNTKREQTKYSIKSLLSSQSTTGHGKGLLVLTVRRVLCYWQRSPGLLSKRDIAPHWSIFGRDDLNEVCELVLGQIELSDFDMRLDWTDFISGKALGRKYKFRGVAVSRRLDRSRLCGEWDVIPDEQKIVYVLVPSSNFSFSKEDELSERSTWEPELKTLACLASENGPSKLTRVSLVCRIFHANESTLYVGDPSIAPHLCSIVLRPSTFIPRTVVTAVQRPKPTKILLLLQDVEAFKGRIVADKLSRILILDNECRAYPEDSCQTTWPGRPGLCPDLLGMKVVLPNFCPNSRPHDLVKMTGVVCDLDETSALMWPACGSCGSSVVTEDTNLHYCAHCSRVSKELVVRMSLVVFVRCPDFPDVSIRVKVLHKTVQALLRTMPKEGQDFMVREALGKPIGPIRCEVTSFLGGNYVLAELPSSLWM